MSQQSKTIFLDASLWSQRWFDDLSIDHQMTYLYLWANSDNVGVWKPHFRELNFKLKSEIDPEEFLSEINSDAKRIEILDNNDWWIIDYLPLQVNTLTPNNRPHVSYIEDLRSHGLLSRYAVENPEHVKFDVIKELQNYDDLEDFEKQKKAKKAFRYLEKKGLVRPLLDSCKALARSIQDSKEKEEEQEEDQVKDEDETKDQEESLTPNSLVQPNDEEAFDESPLKNGPQKKETDSDSVGTIDEKPALYYHKLAKQLKEIIPEDVLANVSNSDIESDLETFHDTLEGDGIDQPRAFIIAKAKRADWDGMRWNDFDGLLFETETPF